MRELIFQAMVSLDGFVEGPNGELDWHNVDEEFNDYSICFLHKVDTLLFGRKTYELMAAYWPSASAMEDDPIVAGHMNSMRKLVCSHTLQQADWKNTEILNDDVVERIKMMKQQPGKDIAILGSCELAKSLIKEQLIDEYRLITNPRLLGKGKTLFTGYDEPLSLQLTRNLVFNSGNVLNYYTQQ